MIVALESLGQWWVDYLVAATLALGMALIARRMAPPLQARRWLAWLTAFALIILAPLVAAPGRPRLPIHLPWTELPWTDSTIEPTPVATPDMAVAPIDVSAAWMHDPAPATAELWPENEVMEQSHEWSPPEPATTVLWPSGWALAGGLLLCGMAAAALRTALGCWGLRRLLRRSRPVDSNCHGIVSAMAAELGRTKVLECDALLTPAAAGVWRPVILLPTKWLEGAGDSELVCLLRHEQAHLRSGDLAFRWLDRLLESFLFIHPLYLLWRRGVRLDQELSADAYAAGDAPEPYAAQLLQWTRLMPRAKPPGRWAPGLAGAEEFLTRRITTLLSETLRDLRLPLSRRRRIALALLVALASSLGGTISFRSSMLQAEQNEPQVTATTDPQTAEQRGGKAVRNEHIDRFEEQLSRMNCRMEFTYRAGFVSDETMERIRATRKGPVEFVRVNENATVLGTWEIKDGVERFDLRPPEVVLEQDQKRAKEAIEATGRYLSPIFSPVEIISDGKVKVSNRPNSFPQVQRVPPESSDSYSHRGPYNWNGRFPFGFSWERCSERAKFTTLSPGRIQYLDKRDTTTIVVDIQFDERFPGAPTYVRSIAQAPGREANVFEWYLLSSHNWQDQWSVPTEYFQCNWRTKSVPLVDGVLPLDTPVPRPDKEVSAGYFVAKKTEPNAVESIRLREPSKDFGASAGIVKLPAPISGFQEIVEATKSEINEPRETPGSELIYPWFTNPAPTGETMDVAGRVLDENGAPAPGIDVELWDLTNSVFEPKATKVAVAMTDSQGRFSLGKHPRPAPQQFRVPHVLVRSPDRGYATATLDPRHFHLIGRAPDSLELLLSRWKSEITGVVFGPNDKPLAGVEFRPDPFLPKELLFTTATSDANGRFRIQMKQPFNRTRARGVLRMVSQEYGMMRFVPEKAPDSIVLAFPAPAVLTMRLVNDAGHPLQGVWVMAQDRELLQRVKRRDQSNPFDKQPEASAKSDADGKVRLLIPGSGTFDLACISADNRVLGRARESIEVTAGQPQELGDIVLAEEAENNKQAATQPAVEMIEVAGRVVDETGEPVAGADVELWDLSNNVFAPKATKVRSAVSDSTGSFSLGKLRKPSTEQFRFPIVIARSEELGRAGRSLNPRDFHLEGREPQSLGLRLKPRTSEIAGVVVGPDKRPLAGVRFCSSPELPVELDFISATSDSDGRFRIPVPKPFDRQTSQGVGFLRMLSEEYGVVRFLPKRAPDNIALEFPRPAIVTMRLVDGAGHPLSGVWVTGSDDGWIPRTASNPHDQHPEANAKSDADGRVRLVVPGSAKFNLVCMSADNRVLGLVREGLEVTAGEPQNLGEIVLASASNNTKQAATKPGAEMIDVAGKVIDEAGKPVVGVDVELWAIGGTQFRQTATKQRVVKSDEQGRFALGTTAKPPSGVGMAPYVIARSAEYGEGSIELEPLAFDRPGCAPGALELRLVRWKTQITGVVLGPDDKPLAGVRLCSFSNRPPEVGLYESVTDANGRFQLRVREPFDRATSQGIGIMRMVSKEYGIVRFIPAKAPDDIVLKFPQPAILTARTVHDSSGRRLAGVDVWLDEHRGSRPPEVTAWNEWAKRNLFPPRPETYGISDENGEVRLIVPGSGKFNVLTTAVEDSLIAPAIEGVDVVAGQNQSLPVIAFSPGAVVKGQLVDKATLKPIELTGEERATISAYGPHRPKSSGAVTSAEVKKDGSFEIRLAGGPNELYLSSRGHFEGARMPFGILEGETRELRYSVTRRQVIPSPTQGEDRTNENKKPRS